MEQVNIKPLSVNDSWKGKRFRTDKYKLWKMYLLTQLPKINQSFTGKLSLCVEFGFSSKGSDIDNPLKPFIDTLCSKYNFNDNQITELIVYKKTTPKGKEFIRFSFKNLN